MQDPIPGSDRQDLDDGTKGTPGPNSFDAAFTALAASSGVREIVRQGLGGDLPVEVEPFSFVPLSGLRDIARAVQVGPSDLLVDLACGRGGPGLWVAAACGARLLGIDFSPVAIAHAEVKAPRFLSQGRARFQLGTLDSTGLDDDSADGLMCVDAFQMADHAATAIEIARVLAPGATAVLTGWESDEHHRWPADMSAVLTTAGLTVISVRQQPDWLALQLDVYARAKAAAALDRDDTAVNSLAAEGDWFTGHASTVRRIVATATHP